MSVTEILTDTTEWPQSTARAWLRGFAELDPETDAALVYAARLEAEDITARYGSVASGPSIRLAERAARALGQPLWSAVVPADVCGDCEGRATCACGDVITT